MSAKDTLKAIVEEFNDKDVKIDFLASLIVNDLQDTFISTNIYESSLDEVLTEVLKANLYECGEYSDREVELVFGHTSLIKETLQDFKEVLNLN